MMAAPPMVIFDEKAHLAKSLSIMILRLFVRKRVYTEVSSRIGFWAGSKRRKSMIKKRAVLTNISLFVSLKR
jgi:hypothetical protein